MRTICEKMSYEMDQIDKEIEPNYPEQLIYKSDSGNYVRSKSEVFIDSALYKNHIPFRYECGINIEDQMFYPDFMILHPQTQKIYYWEHFGMMDNPTYSKKVFFKLQIYSQNNIIPFSNLITTYETKETPLSVDLVQKLIEYYFM